MKLVGQLHVLTAATALAAAATMVGCQQSSGPQHAMEEPTYPARPTMTAQPAAATIAPAAAAPAMASNRMYYPTGDMESSVLLIEKTNPAQIRMGKEFSYQIKVTNLTNSTLQGVIVKESTPGSFNVSNISSGTAAAGGAAAGGEATAGADHENHAAMAAASGNQHTYNIGELKPKESKTITVTGTASQAGNLTSCVTASYSPSLCTTALVTNPELKILKESVGVAPGAGADICQAQTIRYTLTNTGTGELTGVRVEDKLPAGLTTESGADQVAFNVGTLAQGQTRAFEVKVKAHQGGQFASAATASADEGVSAKSEATALNVKAPKLQVTLNAPERQFLGQEAKYEVTIKNVGDAPARSPMVRVGPAAEVGTGAQMAAATEGGQQLGELAPGASKTITVPMSAKAEGEMKVNAVVSDPCAETAMASGQTRVSAVPGLLLSTVDDHDPVKVGDTVTYTISVLNQGFGADHNIHLTATLPDGLQYVSSSGASAGTVQGNKITFAPVANLAARQTLNWTVTAKALKASDIQFRADVITDSFPNGATKMESTRLY